MAFGELIGPREFPFYNGLILPMNSYQSLGPGWRKWVTGSCAFRECASSVGPLSAPISQSPWGERDCPITLSAVKFASGEIWTSRANWQQNGSPGTVSQTKPAFFIFVFFDTLSRLRKATPTQQTIPLCELHLMVYTCNPSTQWVKAKELWTQGHPGLCVVRYIYTHTKQTNKQNPTLKSTRIELEFRTMITSTVLNHLKFLTAGIDSFRCCSPLNTGSYTCDLLVKSKLTAFLTAF